MEIRRTVGVSTVLGLLIAGAGIITPIIWDYYKSKAALELQHLSTATIVQRSQELDKLNITYGGRSIPNITRVEFSLVNSGRTPIRGTDLVSPPLITFLSGTEVLEFQPQSVTPQDLRFDHLVDFQRKTIQIRFPLLNPGDMIRFSVLVSGRQPPTYKASARVVGVPRLLLRDLSADQTNVRGTVPWTVYLVGAVTGLCLFTLLFGLIALGEEVQLRRLARHNASLLPAVVTAQEAGRFLAAAYPAKTSTEFEQIRNSLDALPPTQVLDEVTRTAVQNQLRTAFDDIVPGVAAAIFLGLISAVGLWYVLPYVLV